MTPKNPTATEVLMRQREAVAKIAEIANTLGRSWPHVGRPFGGIDVIYAPTMQRKPRLRLGAVNVSNQFRAEMDAWLLEMFGDYEPHYHIGMGVVVVGPEMMARLQARIEDGVEQLFQKGKA